ncbi:MAG: hypothetical protein IGR92_00290 [Leptolyngbyaceae cyanobacterium T60_A2020_046]|nr:hypothetical protein [Leptolyngbyaceae cyanobacterium T60_A2020_046]
MLVVMTNDQLFAPLTVCQGCLLATQQGQPRWQQGQLRCGRAIAKAHDDQPAQYECEMGFRLANIE